MLSADEGSARIFLSYARVDDESFVRRLHDDLVAAGFRVWFDRESLIARGLTFHQEIKDSIRTEVDRVVYVGGPAAAASPYVSEEWQNVNTSSSHQFSGSAITIVSPAN
jgi:hypothetical protein